MSTNRQKQNARKWALINECIKKGVWEDQKAFREWMVETFKQKSTVLKPSDDALLLDWLLYHTNRTNVKPSGRPSWMISPAQVKKVQDLAAELGWNPATLTDWILKQLHKPYLLESISKDQATRLITGLQRLISYNERKNHV